jgi:hypothetical protein
MFMCFGRIPVDLLNLKPKVIRKKVCTVGKGFDGLIELPTKNILAEKMLQIVINYRKQISTKNIVNVDVPSNNNFNYFLADSGCNRHILRIFGKYKKY